MQKILHNLNPEQLAAVTLPSEFALILAGAGSGKTRVLTTRIAWLLKTGQISHQGVMAVTFTNKAAREMTARLSTMCSANIRSMWIGTFHGLCNRFLRTHYRDTGLPQSFQILDTQDQLSSIKRMLKANGIDDEKYPPRNLMHFINRAKECGLRAGNMDVHDDHERKMTELYSLYEIQCQREGVVDFAELLLRSYELLASNQLLREHYQARFKHILVDEFQDTNDLQYKWLSLLTGGGAAIFAVGDDDQSIYAFRGANVGNMSAFQRDFHVQNMIRLEQNYRSHGHILDAANTLIANNSKRLGKNLHTDAGHGELIRVYNAPSDLNEAQWIVEEVRNLIAEGWLRSEIGVLYRSNAQSRVIEHALFSAGINYRVYGGLRFFERAEIKHAVAYLQLMENPNNDSAFLRVVNFPTRGIGTRTIERLQNAAKQYDISLYEAIPYVDGKAGTSLTGFSRLIEGMRFEAQQMPLPQVVQKVMERSGLLTHYSNEREGADRIENLEQLVSAATLFLSEEGLDQEGSAFLIHVSETTPALNGEDHSRLPDADASLLLIMSPLSGFLSHASLEAGENQAQEGEDALQLMTVHSAKGLEFDGVFITGLEEGLFPHENSAGEEGGLEEERRLMYVAITRARKRLYLSHAQTRMLHGQSRYNIASRFLDELPEEVLKHLSPKKQPWSDRSTNGVRQPVQEARYAQFSPVTGGKTFTRSASANNNGWNIGETVTHQKFGEGVIVNIQGSGGNIHANINFGRHGMKLLDLGIAKLERKG